MLHEIWKLDKQDTWFHYDPPVLIVAITWHQTPIGFGQLLHTHLALSYFNDEDSVNSLELVL